MDAEKPLIKIVREGLEKACKEFSSRVAPLGFSRTSKMNWTREHPLTVDFIGFFRCGSTYGTPRNASVEIRVNCGIRVLNDNFDAVRANGPWSDVSTTRSGRYHLRFNALSGDRFDRCVTDLNRFVVEQGEPWFKKFSKPERLLGIFGSPLNSNEKKWLREALSGQEDKMNRALSLKVLGIKQKGPRG